MTSRPHLTHVALWSADVERSIAFYRKYCGLAVVHRRQEEGSGPVVWLGEDPARPEFVIVLIEAAHARTPSASFAHFGFSCRSRTEVDDRAAMARGDGILDLEPSDGGPVVGYFCIVKDPDGNPVEFSHGQRIGRPAVSASDV